MRRGTLHPMRRALLLAALALVAACGASQAAATSESPGTFMTRILKEELNGQWAKQWSELHPGHQRLISRAQYVQCSRSLATNIATGGETYRVLAVKDEPIHVFGVPQRDAKVVTISFHTPGNSTTPKYALHAVLVGGRWTWILGGRFLSAVQHGRCMSGEPLAQPSTL
jgi:hypothetical protein